MFKEERYEKIIEIINEEKYVSAIVTIAALAICSIAGFIIYKKLLEKESKKALSSVEHVDK